MSRMLFTGLQLIFKGELTRFLPQQKNNRSMGIFQIFVLSEIETVHDNNL